MDGRQAGGSVNLNDYGYSTDYAHQCSAWTINNMGRARKQCGLRVVENIDGWIYLCRRHYELVEQGFAERIESLNAVRVSNLQQRLESTEVRLKVAEATDPPWLGSAMERHDRQRKAQTVYFIRCQQFIKIGIASNPATRLKQIRKGGGSHFPRMLDIETAVIVALEPGGFDREKELHKQFAHLRHTGEWFTEAPELTEYIESLERKAA
jgi:hypothetical protein